MKSEIAAVKADIEKTIDRLEKQLAQLKYDRDHLPHELSGQASNYYAPAIASVEGRLSAWKRINEYT